MPFLVVVLPHNMIISLGKKGTVDLESDALVKVMKHQPSILQQMLATVLNIIMFEDCRNQWSMSRPLLPLILLNNEVWYIRKFDGMNGVNFECCLFPLALCVE